MATQAGVKYVKTLYAEFGDVATRFLDGLWQAQRQAPSQAALMLELSGLYRRPDFIAALERAVRFGAYSLGTNIEFDAWSEYLGDAPLSTIVQSVDPFGCRGCWSGVWRVVAE